MQTKRVNAEMLKNIKGYENRQAYNAPYSSLTGDDKVNSDSSNIKEQVRRDKLVSSLREAIEKCEIKDGMTISFHHHFRAGDKLLMQVVDILAEMGIKNLRIAASSLTSAHNGLVAHIENGVVNRIETSGLRGKLAQAVSEGVLEYPAVIRSHGGRARAITSGDLKIDVAFLAASSADCMGNANGVKGKSICGSMGYAKVDAAHAKKVVVVTDTFVP